MNRWAVKIDYSSSPYLFVGVASAAAHPSAFLGADENGWGLLADRALYHAHAKVGGSYGIRFGTGDIVGCELDCEAGTLSFAVNGVPCGVAFAGLSGKLYPAVGLYSEGTRVTLLPDHVDAPGAGVTVAGAPSHVVVEELQQVAAVLRSRAGLQHISSGACPLPPAFAASLDASWLRWAPGFERRSLTKNGYELSFETNPAVIAKVVQARGVRSQLSLVLRSARNSEMLAATPELAHLLARCVPLPGDRVRFKPARRSRRSLATTAQRRSSASAAAAARAATAATAASYDGRSRTHGSTGRAACVTVPEEEDDDAASGDESRSDADEAAGSHSKLGDETSAAGSGTSIVGDGLSVATSAIDPGSPSAAADAASAAHSHEHDEHDDHDEGVADGKSSDSDSDRSSVAASDSDSENEDADEADGADGDQDAADEDDAETSVQVMRAKRGICEGELIGIHGGRLWLHADGDVGAWSLPLLPHRSWDAASGKPLSARSAASDDGMPSPQWPPAGACLQGWAEGVGGDSTASPEALARAWKLAAALYRASACASSAAPLLQQRSSYTVAALASDAALLSAVGWTDASDAALTEQVASLCSAPTAVSTANPWNLSPAVIGTLPVAQACAPLEPSGKLPAAAAARLETLLSLPAASTSTWPAAASSPIVSIASLTVRDLRCLVTIARFAALRLLNDRVRPLLPFLDMSILASAGAATDPLLPVGGVSSREDIGADAESAGVRASPLCPDLLRCATAARHLLFAHTKRAVLASVLERTATVPRKPEDEFEFPPELPVVCVNRLRAVAAINRAKDVGAQGAGQISDAAAKDGDGTSSAKLLSQSVFGQLFDALHPLSGPTLRLSFAHPMDDGLYRAFRVKLEGEGSDDYSGPYRELFETVAQELLATAAATRADGSAGAGASTDAPPRCLLPFFIPVPNASAGVGDNREWCMLNPVPAGAQLVHVPVPVAGGHAAAAPVDAASSAQLCLVRSTLLLPDSARAHLYFLGQLLGMALRSRLQLPLPLAPSFWRALAMQPISEAHLAAADAALFSSLDGIAAAAMEAASAVLQEASPSMSAPSRDAAAAFVVAAAAASELSSVTSTAVPMSLCAEALRVMELALHATLPPAAASAGASAVAVGAARVREALDAPISGFENLTWTATWASGHEVPLLLDRASGAPAVVTLRSVLDGSYRAAVVQSRLSETAAVAEVVRLGLTSVVPAAVLPLLTGHELSVALSGSPDISIEVLEANAEYDEGLTAEDEHIRVFWRVLRSLSPKEKALFLRFVWGRSSLPPSASDWSQRFKIQDMPLPDATTIARVAAAEAAAGAAADALRAVAASAAGAQPAVGSLPAAAAPAGSMLGPVLLNRPQSSSAAAALRRMSFSLAAQGAAAAAGGAGTGAAAALPASAAGSGPPSPGSARRDPLAPQSSRPVTAGGAALVQEQQLLLQRPGSARPPTASVRPAGTRPSSAMQAPPLSTGDAGAAGAGAAAGTAASGFAAALATTAGAALRPASAFRPQSAMALAGRAPRQVAASSASAAASPMDEPIIVWPSARSAAAGAGVGAGSGAGMIASAGAGAGMGTSALAASASAASGAGSAASLPPPAAEVGSGGDGSEPQGLAGLSITGFALSPSQVRAAAAEHHSFDEAASVFAPPAADAAVMASTLTPGATAAAGTAAAAAPSEGDGRTSAVRQRLLDGQMFSAHVCFFALRVPRQLEEAVMRRNLLLAITECVAMDGDYRVSGRDAEDAADWAT